MTKSGVELLAHEVSKRRGELRKSREQLAEEAHMSRDAIRAIEQMEDRNYRPATKRALEQVLGWVEGSIDGILDRKQPPKLLPTAFRADAAESFDPMTASNAELGAHADWISETSGDPAVGAAWLAGVLRQRQAVEVSHGDDSQGQRRAM
jgi:transcriptional regulator with XRE-family HTH domain